jgi:hypothetical protein
LQTSHKLLKSPFVTGIKNRSKQWGFIERYV